MQHGQHLIQVDPEPGPCSEQGPLCASQRLASGIKVRRKSLDKGVLGPSLNNALTCHVTLVNNIPWKSASVSPSVH